MLKRLRERELATQNVSSFPAEEIGEKFKGFDVRGKLETSFWVDKFGQGTEERRSRVTEIYTSENILLALNSNGVCIALDLRTGAFLCHLNTGPDEVIRSLFFHTKTRAIITVSVFRYDNFKSLKCRHISLDFIGGNAMKESFLLFENEQLSYPGFVEFDDVNDVILTFSNTKKMYKIWSFGDYKPVFSYSSVNVRDVKTSPGAIMFICKAPKNHLYLKIGDIKTGEIVYELTTMVQRDVSLEFLEQCGDKILLKQTGYPLKIMSIIDNKVIQVPGHTFQPPNSFIFLYEIQLFLTFHNSTLKLWNFQGQLLNEMNHGGNASEKTSTNHCYISSKQNIVICYTRDSTLEGKISICNLETGEPLCTITGEEKESNQNSLRKKALREVTALHYNEDTNELISGNRNGEIFIWARRDLRWNIRLRDHHLSLYPAKHRKLETMQNENAQPNLVN